MQAKIDRGASAERRKIGRMEDTSVYEERRAEMQEQVTKAESKRLQEIGEIR